MSNGPRHQWLDGSSLQAASAAEYTLVEALHHYCFQANLADMIVIRGGEITLRMGELQVQLNLWCEGPSLAGITVNLLGTPDAKEGNHDKLWRLLRYVGMELGFKVDLGLVTNWVLMEFAEEIKCNPGFGDKLILPEQ